ncbi:MAG: hypothetical protein R3F07_02660 [Opitutaceae bacterium]
MLNPETEPRHATRPSGFRSAVLLGALLGGGLLTADETGKTRVLSEWSDLKGVEGFEDLEGIEDPMAINDLESIEDLEQLDRLIGLDGLDLEIPTWEHEITLFGSLGYKDNILLQPTDPEASGFFRSEVEFFLWQLPTGSTEFSVMFDATDVRYFSADETDGEQMAFLHGNWSWLTARWSKLSAVGQLIYQDQVLDMSANELEPFIGQVQVFSGSLDPEWELSVTRNLNLSVSGLVRADRFREGPDDFDDLGFRVGAGYQLARWADLEVRFTALTRDYATRVQYTAGGRPLLGTRLSIDQRDAEVRLQLGSGSDGGWKLRTKFGHLQYRDNGSGYFDYDRATLGLELGWSPGPWVFTLRGDYHRYDYLSQTVWTGELENRLKEDLYGSVRLERSLSESLRWHLEGEWENSWTNDIYGDYHAVAAYSGVSWSF